MASRISDAERIKRYAPLNLTAPQAEELCAYDKVCEQSDPSPTSKNFIPTPYDASEEQRAVIKKMTRTGQRKAPTAYKFTKRQRKENATKAAIIEEIRKFFTENSEFSVENMEVLNKERQVSFSIGADKFELTLTQKRKPKGV